MKILIADDDQLIRSMLTDLLEELGHTVVSAVNGLEADAAEVERARRYIASQGAYGLVSAEQFSGSILPYTNNLVNLVVVQDAGNVPMSEVMRVLAPGGSACIIEDGKWKSVYYRGRDGWVVICGCCHRGLFNTLHLARFLAHEDRISAVVGGLHLRNCGQDQLREVMRFLQEVHQPDLYVGHCTGRRAVDFLTIHYAGKVTPLAAGRQFQP